MIYERQSGSPPRGRLYRASSRDAMVFGVCAGIADHFGFDRTVTRIITFVAALVFFPAVLIGYVILALLLKRSPELELPTAERRSRIRDRTDAEERFDGQQRRVRDLDRRLQRLEEHITSRRFKLEREFDKLKD